MAATVVFQGGLGNQLFQLAFLEYICKKTGRKPFLNDISNNCGSHTKQVYFNSIFQNWKTWYNPLPISIVLSENSKLASEDWVNSVKSIPGNVQVSGYFQRFEYTDPIRDQFISRLTFNTSCTQKYPWINEYFFIHIRGGDYKNNKFHEVVLEKYYRSCIKLCKNEKFIVFTNDHAHVKTILGDHDYTILMPNEIDTLYLMGQCKGGICANSTFSWWGAYLNPNRKLFFPNKWFNDVTMDITGFYFNGCTAIDTIIEAYDFVEKIVYINLDHRADRRKSIENVLKNVCSEKIVRFSACSEPTMGHLGCAKSHVEVLKMAIQQKWENVLILEDDAVYNNFNATYPLFEKLSKNPFDVIVVGGTAAQFDRKTYKVSKACCTTGYLINRHYYTTLLENFSETVIQLTNDYSQHHKFAIDQNWHKLMRKDNWLITSPSLFHQVSDYSDIENKIMPKYGFA